MADLREIEYPYYRFYKSLEQILEDFESLKKYRYDYIIKSKEDIYSYLKKNKKSTLSSYIQKNKNDIIYMLNIEYIRDAKYLSITDYFSQECRVECNFGEMISPLEYFRLNKKVIIENLGNKPSYNDIDDYFYKNGVIQCSNFHLVVCSSLLNFFKPKHWLDPSAGWGDRLISCINYGDCTYHASDPNDCLQGKYKKMIDTLALDKDKYKIEKIGFEDLKVEKEYYDLVFTSPPFFDLEKYSNNPDQSHIKFNNLEDWIINFMYPLIKKSIYALVSGGHLCLYINDNKRSGVIYVKKVKEYLAINKSLKFMGNIAWYTGKYPREIIVYKKL